MINLPFTYKTEVWSPNREWKYDWHITQISGQVIFNSEAHIPINPTFLKKRSSDTDPNLYKFDDCNIVLNNIDIKDHKKPALRPPRLGDLTEDGIAAMWETLIRGIAWAAIAEELPVRLDGGCLVIRAPRLDF